MQASDIADLIVDYKEIMMCRSESTNGSDLPSKGSPEPLSGNSTTNHLVTTTVEVDETKL